MIQSHAALGKSPDSVFPSLHAKLCVMEAEQAAVYQVKLAKPQGWGVQSRPVVLGEQDLGSQPQPGMEGTHLAGPGDIPSPIYQNQPALHYPTSPLPQAREQQQREEQPGM